jgi:hypothetical protein
MLRAQVGLFFLMLAASAWSAPEPAGATSAVPFGAKPSESLPPIPASLAGHWANTENNATVGLIIQADKNCELYTERLTSPRSSRACKVELYRGDTYLLYLKGANGQCGANADFEFRYLKSQEASLERLDLDTGGSTHFLLERRMESPVADTAGKKST